MKFTIIQLVILIILTITYGCLEPSGEEGYAVGKRANSNQETDSEIQKNSTSTNEEEAQSEPTFELIQPVISNSCATASCHSSAGGIIPTLETAEQWRTLTADTTDGNERTNGQAAAETVDGASGAIPMPPAGSEPLTEEQIQSILEWVDLGMP